MRKLISSEYDPVTGITTNHFSQNGGKQVVVQRVQDAEPFFLQNAVERNSYNAKSRDRFRKDGLGTKVASIPPAMVEKFMREKGINVLNCPVKDLHKILNDSEYSKLRTADGEI